MIVGGVEVIELIVHEMASSFVPGMTCFVLAMTGIEDCFCPNTVTRNQATQRHLHHAIGIFERMNKKYKKVIIFTVDIVF